MFLSASKTRLLGLALGLVATGLAVSAPAMANDEQRGYVGAGAIEWSSNVAGLPKYEATTWRLRGGWHINDTFAVEAHIAAQGSEEEVSGIEHELKHVVGAYLKAQTPTARDLRGYALLGVAHSEMNHINPFVEGDISDTGLSYGVGVEVLLMGGLSLKLDATRYLDTSDHTLDAIGAELGLRF